MRRVLVALDGTELGASILPDARRYAGPQGTLILVQNADSPHYLRGTRRAETFSVDHASAYLDAVADELRADGTQVESHVLVLGDPAYAIDEAATIYGADMIAVATHGRGPFARLVRGSVAWRALAHSPVPVLLRHPSGGPSAEAFVGPRRIMVPLDGSAHAERALRLAREIASSSAELLLVRVAPVVPGYAALGAPYGAFTLAQVEEARESQRYLDSVAETVPCRVTAKLLEGPVSSSLIDTARRCNVTDVVMASHGRTGLCRAVLGSVTDDLVQHLHCPIVVLPSLNPVRDKEPQQAEHAQPRQTTLTAVP